MDTLWLNSAYTSWTLPKINLLLPGETVEKEEHKYTKGKHIVKLWIKGLDGVRVLNFEIFRDEYPWLDTRK